MKFSEFQQLDEKNRGFFKFVDQYRSRGSKALAGLPKHTRDEVKKVAGGKEENEEVSDEWFDRAGRPNPNGAYDAGGHYHAERDTSVKESVAPEQDQLVVLYQQAVKATAVWVAAWRLEEAADGGSEESPLLSEDVTPTYLNELVGDVTVTANGLIKKAMG